MRTHTLSDNIKIQKLEVVDGGGAYQAAAAVDGDWVNSGEVDTQGYEACLILYVIGTGVNAAVVAVKAQQDIVSAMTTAADLAGSLQTITDVGGNKLNRIVGLVVYRPKERYLRLRYQRTVQSSAIDSIIAILYNPQQMPVSQATGLGGFAGTVTTLNSPAEGTA